MADGAQAIDAAQALTTLVLGGLLGMIGQGARSVAGMKKLSDSEAVSSDDLFSASRLVVSLMIGFVAGVIATLSLGLGKLASFDGNVSLLLGIAASGYVGSDMIEAFAGSTLSKLAPPVSPSGTDWNPVPVPVPNARSDTSPRSSSNPQSPPADHLRVLSPAKIGEAFGVFTWQEAATRGRIVIDQAWIAANIETVEIPELAELVPDGKVQCNRAISASLKSAFAEVSRQGLMDRILKFDGLWVARHKTWDPSRSLSSHSWGIAFDINAAWNSYGRAPAPLGAEGCVMELVPIFEKFGFAWGGYFRPDSARDGMHFEYCRSSPPSA